MAPHKLAVSDQAPTKRPQDLDLPQPRADAGQPEQTRTIPVAMAADLNYAKPMSVAITSLLENSGTDTGYDLRILVAEEFPADVRDQFLSFEGRYPGNTISFVVVDGFADVKVSTSHLTAPAYFRLKLPDLFPDVDRIIYLDVDTIIESDLWQLYTQDVDDAYVAAVPAAAYHLRSTEAAQAMGLPSFDRYVNSGVMLMNLKQMREHGLVAKFLELSSKEFDSDDQDIINIVCYDRIRHLPLRFNLMTKYGPKNVEEFWSRPAVRRVWSRDEYDEAMSSPVIIHFADKRKPWMDVSADFADRWWQYAAMSPMCGEIVAVYLADAVAAAAGVTSAVRKRLRSRVVSLEQELQGRDQELADTRRSVSFRIGALMTSGPRVIRDSLKRDVRPPQPRTRLIEK
ncbi:glycosyltransferase family 8 protein [Nocardioides sp. NPDC057767]|uniref:glycosyltransferase family 8 protein n=1 Tax=unclassified Nocardioides TaxID=2615069 RepID=UPI0036710281